MTTTIENFSLLRSSYGYCGKPRSSEPVHAFVFPTDGGAEVTVYVGSASARSKRPLTDDEIHPFIRTHLALLGADVRDLQWEPSKAPLSQRHPGQHRERHIYYIQDEDGFIKIGVANNVKNRLATLQTGARQRLTLLASHSGTSVDERALHGRFAHLRTRGEWFEPGPELIQHIGGMP